MTDEDDVAPSDDDYRQEDFPREASEIEQYEIERALKGLTFLGESLAMRFQVTNIGIVDTFIMALETRVRGRLHSEDRTPVDDAMFLQAQTQMWIFAVYELLRTWRQRALDVIKLAENGGLQHKIDALRKGTTYQHFNREFYADLLERVVDDRGLVDKLETDIRRTGMAFARLEFIRVALAKHEVSGKTGSLAFNPGYARIDHMTGSLQYELSNDKYITGMVTRREIADEIREFPGMTLVPLQEDIRDYKKFLEGKDGFVPPEIADEF